VSQSRQSNRPSQLSAALGTTPFGALSLKPGGSRLVDALGFMTGFQRAVDGSMSGEPLGAYPKARRRRKCNSIWTKANPVCIKPYWEILRTSDFNYRSRGMYLGPERQPWLSSKNCKKSISFETTR